MKPQMNADPVSGWHRVTGVARFREYLKLWLTISLNI
jgi:hypothetical protein